MMKRLGYGAILWLIPYVTAIPLLPLMQSDNALFKTIMIVEGALVGAALTAHYFQEVERDHLREGIILAAVWIVLNWLLDFVALLPFTNQTLPRYFAEIGLRYLAIAAPAVAVGYVLERKFPNKTSSG
jgi:uncharacterized membrane protein YpjA